jgi:hypothetical protein
MLGGQDRNEAICTYVIENSELLPKECADYNSAGWMRVKLR